MSGKKSKKTDQARLPFKVLDIRAAFGITPTSKKRKASGDDSYIPSKSSKLDPNSDYVVLLDEDPEDMIVDVENVPVGPETETPSKSSQHFMRKYLRVSLKRLELDVEADKIVQCTDKTNVCREADLSNDASLLGKDNSTFNSLDVPVLCDGNQQTENKESQDSNTTLGNKTFHTKLKDLLNAPIKNPSIPDEEISSEEDANDEEADKETARGDELNDSAKQCIENNKDTTTKCDLETEPDKSFETSACDVSEVLTVDSDSSVLEESGQDNASAVDKATNSEAKPGDKQTNNKKRKHRSKVESEEQKAARKAEKQRIREAAKQRKEQERQKLKEDKEKARAEKTAEKEKEREKKRLQEEKEKAEKEKARKEKLQQKESERLEKLRMKEEQKLKKQQFLDAKLEEKKKKEDERNQKLEEKKKLEEEEERKKQKARDAFAKFFVKSQQQKQQPITKEEKKEESRRNFKPFEIRKDMTLAPTVPLATLTNFQKEIFEDILKNQRLSALYLEELRSGNITPFKFKKQQRTEEVNDVIVVCPPVSTSNMQSKHRPKLLQFHTNVRPPYWGTWSKKSKTVGPRRPFGKDESHFDYEIDSDDEWEEEEPGESLSGTEDEKEPEDDYEIDNEFMVPHGYLSPEEELNEEPESPETFKLRLKMKEQQFKAELNKKCPVLKPVINGCLWVEDFSTHHTLEQFRMVVFEAVPIFTSFALPVPSNEEETPKASSTNSDTENGSSKSKGCARRSEVPEEAMPRLLTLIHANTNCRSFIMQEFTEYWTQQCKPTDVPSPSGETGSEKSEHAQEKDAGATCQTPTPKNEYFSKRQLKMMFQKVATWTRCPDPAMNKYCWWVHENVREKYNLLDLPVPNQWQYVTEKESESTEGTPSIKKFAQIVSLNRNQNQPTSTKSNVLSQSSSADLETVEGQANCNQLRCKSVN